MHVGGLFEFTLPPDADDGYLQALFGRMRAAQAVPPPWNLKLLDTPVVGSRLPVMREIHDVDLDYHVRHSALPHPGGQRELGVLVSRLHSNELDLHRPLWEVHLIEGLEGNRFALYTKMHHSLIDGVSGMRLIMRAFSTDPDQRGMPPFWTIGAGERPRPAEGDDHAAVAARAPARRGARRAPPRSPALTGGTRPRPRGSRQPGAAGPLPRARLGARRTPWRGSVASPRSSTS